MDAKELRIGNKLQKSNGEIFTVLRLDNTKDVLVFEQRGLLALDYNLFGIPLTVEWLLKTGARKNQMPNGYWMPLTNLKAELHFETFDNTDEIVTTIISQYCELILDRIKYVHNFQNIYWCLTGQELTLNP